jgi:hypothetical protein
MTFTRQELLGFAFACRYESVWIGASPNSAVAEFGTPDAQFGFARFGGTPVTVAVFEVK